MIAARLPIQRPSNAKVLFVDGQGNIEHHARSEFADLLRPGDVVVANDAATLPASLFGQHSRTGRRIEVRLAGRDSLDEIRQFSAVVFGEGDFHTPTEDRSKPPKLKSGDRLKLGRLRGIVVRSLSHPRLILLQFEGSLREIWEGLARHGRPIQYAHVQTPLAVWDTWTPIAGPPVAFEAPSAGFTLDWSMLASMSARKIRFGTITHAAGLSSTGDPELDALLPLPEPYRISRSTALMIKRALKSQVDVSSQLVPRSPELWNTRLQCLMASCHPASGWRRKDLTRQASCELSMQFSPALTSGAPVITSCCALSSMIKHLAASTMH